MQRLTSGTLIKAGGVDGGSIRGRRVVVQHLVNTQSYILGGKQQGIKTHNWCSALGGLEHLTQIPGGLH